MWISFNEGCLRIESIESSITCVSGCDLIGLVVTIIDKWQGSTHIENVDLFFYIYIYNNHITKLRTHFDFLLYPKNMLNSIENY